jgi:hypothetical protein
MVLHWLKPDPLAVANGSKQFRIHEKRDSMYRVATHLIEEFWGQPSWMADSLGVLLLTWNAAFYRYGPLDFDALDHTISDNLRVLSAFRARDISSFTVEDETPIRSLFSDFSEALKLADEKKKGTKSPVSAAKALHLLAPAFLPLWDDKIANAYDCNYAKNSEAQYIKFLKRAKDMAAYLDGKLDLGGYTLLKVIDEYNYAKFTKHWI